MAEKFLFFIEENVNINTKRKFFIKENNKFTVSLYKLDEEDNSVLNELGSDDYMFTVFCDINEEVINKVLNSKGQVITDVVTSAYLINLPKGLDYENEDLEVLLKYFLMYVIEENDLLFDNFLSIVEENGWYSSKEEAEKIYLKNEKFFNDLDSIVLENNFLIKYIDKETFLEDDFLD